MDIEREIFNRVAYLSNKESEYYQIEDNTEDEVNQKYRLYHCKGYCADVSMEYDEETDRYDYRVSQHFEGFNVVSMTELLTVLN